MARKIEVVDYCLEWKAKFPAGGCEDSRNFRRKLYYCLSYWFHFREGTAGKADH